MADDIAVISRKEVPANVRTYPEIADFLTADVTEDSLKIWNIYEWIGHHIAFDPNFPVRTSSYETNQDIIDHVLTTRKGVCQHYAELAHAMLEHIGVPSYLVAGYARKSSGVIGTESHLWNAVQLKGAFYFFDVTWGAGYVDHGVFIPEFSDRFFMVDPPSFISHHMPFDPLWQFSAQPISHTQFIDADYDSLTSKPTFLFKETLANYQSSDRKTQIKSTLRRLADEEADLPVIQFYRDVLAIELTKREYNQAVDTLNYAVDVFNEYIRHKNNRFRDPDISDESLVDYFDRVGTALRVANDIFFRLTAENDQLYQDILNSRNDMETYFLAFDKEQTFLERYLVRPTKQRYRSFNE